MSTQTAQAAPLEAAAQLDPVHLRILSRMDWIQPVVMHLRDQAVESGACDDAAASRLVIAMTEALTNAVVHGNYELPSDLRETDQDAFNREMERRADDPELARRVVDIRAEYSADRCVWTITDQGRGFDVGEALRRLDRDDEDDLERASGRGIAIMRAFVDEVKWDQDGRRIHLALTVDHSQERRRSPRQKYVEPLRVGLLDEEEGADLDAIARDLSATGVRFVTTRPVARDAAVEITLEPDRANGTRLRARIVRCSHVAGEFHDVAARFDEPFDVGSLLEASA